MDSIEIYLYSHVIWICLDLYPQHRYRRSNSLVFLSPGQIDWNYFVLLPSLLDYRISLFYHSKQTTQKKCLGYLAQDDQRTVAVFGRSCHSSSSYHRRPSSIILAISAVIRARGVYSPGRSGFFCCCLRFEGGVGVMIRILSISSSSNSKSDSSFSLQQKKNDEK